MTESFRRPAAFRVDDPRVVVAEPEIVAARAHRQRAGAMPTAEIADAIASRSRRWRWGTLFWSACSGLVLLALGLAVTSFVEELFARAPWLGAVGLALAVVGGLALLALVAARDRRPGPARHHRGAAPPRPGGDRERRPRRGRAVVADLLALTRRMPRLAARPPPARSATSPTSSTAATGSGSPSAS